jgi:hypothetical protein
MSHPLVASDRVEAAVVYGPDGQKIGTIERLMLEKLSGTVAYGEVRRKQLRSGLSELDGGAFDWGDRGFTYPQYWIL